MKILLRRKRKRAFEKLLISLSIADLLFGLSKVTENICKYLPTSEEMVNQHWGKFFGSLYFIMFFGVSVLHLLYIAVDRMMAVHSPIHHRCKSLNGRLEVAIAFLWIEPLLSVTLHLTYCQIKGNGISVWDDPNGFIGPLMARRGYGITIIAANIILFIAYSRIVYYANFQRLNVKKWHKSILFDKKQQRLLVLSSCTTISFMVCTMPYVAVLMTTDVWPSSWILNMFASNSAVNSMIFLIQYYMTKQRSKKQSASTLQAFTL